MRAFRNCKGVITIFVALMMAGILSLGTFVLEAARLQAARTQLDQAAASAASSMLSAYNLDLEERFGVFAMDTTRTNDETCADYVRYNSDLAADAYGNNVTRLYRVTDVKMKGVYNLTYPHILKRQLLTLAKYNLPPEVSAFNKYNAHYILGELQTKCQYVSDKMQKILDFAQDGNPEALGEDLRNAMAALDQTFGGVAKANTAHGVTLNDSTVAKLPSVTDTVESTIPESINLSAVDMFYAWNDPFQVDDQGAIVAVRPEYLYELPDACKRLADTVNAAINMLWENMDENVLLNMYVSQMFSNRRHVTDQYIGPGLESTESGSEDLTFAKACCEYVFGGDASELQNQEAAYDYIMALRLIGNLYATLGDFDVTDGCSAATGMALAYYETCLDLYLLTEYDMAVPLRKDRQILRADNLGAIADAFSGHDPASALYDLGYYDEAIAGFVITGADLLDYTDSLNLALWMVPNTQKLLRVADLMQLEMRYQQRYVEGLPATFLMSEQNTYCRVECKGKMNAILPIIAIGGEEHSLQGLSLSTLKYAGY